MKRFQSRLVPSIALALASTMLLLTLARATAQTPGNLPSNPSSNGMASNASVYGQPGQYAPGSISSQGASSSQNSSQSVYRLPPAFQSPDPVAGAPDSSWSGPPVGNSGPAMTLPPPVPANRSWPNSAYPPAAAYPSGTVPTSTPFDDPFGDRVSADCDPNGPPCPMPGAAPSRWPFGSFCDRLKGWAHISGGQSGASSDVPAPIPGGSNLFTTPDNPLDDEHLLGKWTLMNFTVFGGIQGFQGPPDEKQGSNFGFHEGFNWAVPLFESWGISHQTGVSAVQSDLSGGSGFNTNRNQFFLTSGFYHRPVNGVGFQFGGCLDYMHDDWYVKMDLSQLRLEGSWVGKVHEVGFMTMTHTSVDSKTSPITNNSIQWQTIDQYLLFYRRRLHGIGQARLWAGVTGDGAPIFGGDGTSMLTTHWGFQTNFNTTYPKSSNNINDVSSWGLSFNIVWFPGYDNPRSGLNPYKALFDVADNTLLLIQQTGK